MRRVFPRRQAGLSTAGWLLLIMVFGSVITIGMKLIPVFVDNNTMSNILDGIAEEDGISNRADSDIKKMIQKRFKMNNVRDFSVRDNIKIERTRDGTKVIMDYEVRQNLFRNVDLISSFDKTVELKF